MAKKKSSSKSNSKSKKNPSSNPKSGGPLIYDFSHLKKLIDLMENRGLSEISWKAADSKSGVTGEEISLKRGGFSAAPAMMSVPMSAPAPSAGHSSSDVPVQNEDSGKYKKIFSPFVGTYYSAPSPGADSYVKVGQKITKGQVLCIVEAMKLMNEIESEETGTLVEILVENGQPVEYGEALFIVEP